MGINFNELSWDKLKELVLRHIGEYENVSELPNQFYVSDDGLINIGYFNTFEEAMNFEPQNGWCTSVNQGRFEEHHNINHEMLYIIRNCKLSKSSNCRFVVAQVNLDGSRIYWDQKNNNLNATNGDNHISAKEYETSLGNAINQLQPMKLKTENKQYKSNTNMNKKLIRLTESDLHKIVKEAVNKILTESSIDDVFDGMPHTYTVDLYTKSEGKFGYAFSNIRNYDELNAAIKERFPDVLNWKNPRRNKPFNGWH